MTFSNENFDATSEKPSRINRVFQSVRTLLFRPLVLGRLSIRKLLLFVLAIGVFLGWVEYRARDQFQTVEAIRRAGGQVRYDWLYPGYDSPNKTVWPRWVESTLGVDYLHNVTYIDAGPVRLSDDFLDRIGRLKHLNFLRFQASDTTDAGLAHLNHLSGLTHLEVVDARRITGLGLVPISRMTGLQELRIDNLTCTDADLAHLSGLTGLVTLGLSFDASSKVGDAGLAHLRPLHKLLILRLNRSTITTQGLDLLREMMCLSSLELKNAKVKSLTPLKPLAYLSVLDLTGNPIGGEGLAICKDLPRLERLNLSNDLALSDADLAHLRGLPRLRRLDLRGTNIADSGMIHLLTCPELKLMDLADTKLGDPGVATLATGTIQRTVILKRTQVNPAMMATTSAPSSQVFLQLE